MKFFKLLTAMTCMFIFLFYTFPHFAKAQHGGSREVSATVVIGVVSVEITPSNFNYGVMPFGAAKESFDVIKIAQQRNVKATVSIVPTDLYIKGVDTDAWILADEPGTNQYIHRFGIATDTNTRPSSYTDLTTSNKLLAANIPPEGSIWLGLQIVTPTSGTTSQQSAGVIITAFHAD